MRLSKTKFTFLLSIACLVPVMMAIWMFYPQNMEGMTTIQGLDEPTTKLLLTIQSDVQKLYNYLTPLATANFTSIKPNAQLSFFYGQVSVLQSIFTNWVNYSLPASPKETGSTPNPPLDDMIKQMVTTFQPMMQTQKDLLTLLSHSDESNAQNLYFKLGQLCIMPTALQNNTQILGTDSTSTELLTTIQKNITAVFELMKPILQANIFSTTAPSPTLPNGMNVYQCGQIFALNIIMTYWTNTIPSTPVGTANSVTSSHISSQLSAFKTNLGSMIQTCQKHLSSSPSGSMAVELYADYGLFSIVQAGLVVIVINNT